MFKPLLNIKQGRHLRISHENRVCNYCLQRHVFVTENETLFSYWLSILRKYQKRILPEIVKPCDSEFVFKYSTMYVSYWI